MSKQLLTLTQLAGDPPTPDRHKRFRVQINPAEFSQRREIRYNTDAAQGKNAAEARFSAMEPDTVSFTIVFDGTGAVPSENGDVPEVVHQIDKLSSVVYNYNSSSHEPPRVQISWGTLIFNGRLSSFDTQYTLFKPSGAPLRARCTLSFMGTATNTQANLEANRSSPDLSHSVLVVDGDTLPLLCLRIYGDARYYPDVAAHNGLRTFRRLQPGTRLNFPPLS
ncbi:peptidoglycan-binding protein [Leptothrix ochracea]|uniref:CIS tube protein n=1 Tax=Leptothrix ochracea TaxID=735331 RepID=UPI0034E2E879